MAKKIMSFDEVVGHKNLIRFLKEHIEEDNIADVVIFHGTPGVGKSSLAKLLAIEVAYRWEKDEAAKQKCKESVILQNASTDTIKLFNMSEISEKEEEIQRVKADLSTGFSKTGRKVLIMDEAHNMSKKAQDAILTEIEHLQKGVYVFICTTEISALREALQSRGKATFRLNALTDAEARILLNRVITQRKLRFDISQEVVVTLVMNWANNQPRKMCNLLDNFDDGSLVSSRDLEVFMNTSSAASVIELTKYIYDSLPLGLAYVDSLKLDESFATMLIEVCKVALGGMSNAMSTMDIRYIKEFMADKDVNNLLRFTVEVAGLSDLRKRRVVAAFIKSNITFKQDYVPVKPNEELVHGFDLQEVAKGTDNSELPLGSSDVSLRVPTLDELFKSSDNVVNEGYVMSEAIKALG